MAYGRHWEWRGFGLLDAATRARISSLPALFAEPEVVTDEYLWVPGVRINVKVRRRGKTTLKLKRLERTDPSGDFELWIERETEEYAFPLGPEVAGEVAGALGVRLEVSTALGCDEFLKALASADPRIRLVSVQKTRQTRVQPGDGGRLLVEIAEIDKPEAITSVSVEDAFELGANATAAREEAALRAVAEAVRSLGFDRGLRPLSYLEAIARWANGDRVE